MESWNQLGMCNPLDICFRLVCLLKCQQDSSIQLSNFLLVLRAHLSRNIDLEGTLHILRDQMLLCNLGKYQVDTSSD